MPDPIGTLFRWIEKTASLAPEGEMQRSKRPTGASGPFDRPGRGPGLSLKPSDEQAMQSHFLKLQALSELVELSERGERMSASGPVAG